MKMKYILLTTIILLAFAAPVQSQLGVPPDTTEENNSSDDVNVTNPFNGISVEGKQSSQGGDGFNRDSLIGTAMFGLLLAVIIFMSFRVKDENNISGINEAPENSEWEFIPEEK